MSFTCDYCAKKFDRKCNILFHISREVCKKSKNKPYQCEICMKHYSALSALLTHKKLKHKYTKPPDLPTDFVTLEFENLSEFYRWKDKIEQDTFSKYVRQTRIWRTKNNLKKSKFVCHRSGRVRLLENSLRKRSLKKKGSCKINQVCRSLMMVEEKPDQKVTVKFVQEHSNHKEEIKHLTISSAERNNIADKLRRGDSFDKIVDDIRGSASVSDGLSRIHLLTRKDLHNIANEFNISVPEGPETNDKETSAQMLIDEYKAKFGSIDTPFRFYKERGSEVPYLRGADKNDFVLIIITPVQKSLMQEFGTEKICVESTYDTNACNLFLTTVLVVDYHNMAVAAAYCISSVKNIELLTFFFEIIKKDCGVISTKIFMFDDTAAYLNAWTQVMQEPEKALLCTWHVDKNWRQNLSHVDGSTELKNEVYKIIRTLLLETDQTTFFQLLNSSITELMRDRRTAQFGRYFLNEYAQRTEMWANAFRTETDISTNKELQTVHRAMKKGFLKGLKVKRLDLAIENLLKMDRDMNFNRLNHFIMDSRKSTERNIRNKHIAGMELMKECVFSIHSGGFEISSQKDKTFSYSVQNGKDMCDCNLRCTDCQICVHSFVCSCADYSIHGNLCKHIHAVVMFQSQVSNAEQSSNIMPVEAFEIREQIITVDENIDCVELEQSTVDNCSIETLRNRILEFYMILVNEQDNVPTNAGCANALHYLNKSMDAFCKFMDSKSENNNANMTFS